MKHVKRTGEAAAHASDMTLTVMLMSCHSMTEYPLQYPYSNGYFGVQETYLSLMPLFIKEMPPAVHHLLTLCSILIVGKFISVIIIEKLVQCY